MKYSILLGSAMAISMAASAQNNDLSGTWRETGRITNAGSQMAFGDTIKLNFLTGGEYTWMKKGGFIYRGTYKIENGMLDLGMRQFTVLDRNDNRMVLRDDEATYEFTPYTEASRPKLAKEAEPLPVVSIIQMRGDWEVFKRTSARTMKDVDYKTMLQRANITDMADAQGYYGYVAAATEKDGTKRRWNITRYEDGKLYTSGPSSRVFEVIKAEKELILKDGDITYFFKQFN